MTDAEPTYEQAREELVQIVAKLEAGGTTLEDSLALWQRGEELATLCERYLDGARERLDAAGRPDATTSDDGANSASTNDGVNSGASTSDDDA